MTTTYGCLSDIHAGSTMAGCLKPVQLDDGGWYEPSPIQEYINTRLRRFAEACAAARREKFVLVLNGDLTDGQIKESGQVASSHPHTEFAILKDILDLFVALKPDAVIVTRGTGAHVGKSGHKDEAAAHYLAKECGLAVLRSPDTGRYSSYQSTTEPEGHLVYVKHHGKAGSVSWSNVASNRAFHIWSQHVLRGLRPPTIVLQGHNHKFDDSWWKHPTRVVQQASFQLKTDHAWKVVPDELNDLGGVIMQFARDTRPEVTAIVYPPDPPKPMPFPWLTGAE